MLLDQIKQDQLSARKNQEKDKALLLTTLFSEAQMVGKNAGNRVTTDDEVVKVIQKFVKGINETIEILSKDGKDFDAITKAQNEKTILESYLPKMASDDEITEAINEFAFTGGDMSKIGLVMAHLKKTFGSAFNAKRATEIIKSLQ